MRKQPFQLLLPLLLVPCFVQGADKSEYSLFNPTPRGQMREMSTDRPDTTESAYSVDAGHFQVEATLFGFAKDGSVESMVFAETNYKLGLTNRTDLQLVVPFFEKQRGGEDDDEGIGDLLVRWKWNLWGNDEGGTALAFMPFVKTPTAGHDLGNDKVEGGLIIPFAAALGERAGFACMAEFDVAYDEASGDYGVDFVNTATIGVDLTDRWGAFVEFISVASTREDTPWEGYGKAGVTFVVSEDLVIDAGAATGLNDEAEDFVAFTGFSFRY